jgi:superfamily II DNA/RNA helicase
MTRLIALELDNRNINYRYLHGAVPGKDRGKLLTDFTNDASCKVFLSTDAGSVGLNLQTASLLINLDIPWSPAVLEQRISRIHRLGQKKPITVINLVAAGTIEQRMLDVIAFKDSLAKGVLDNGDDSVFMGESRFKTFIGEIEKIIDTTSVGSAESVSPDEIEAHESTLPHKPNEPMQLHLFDDDESEDSQTDAVAETNGEMNELLHAGISFFDQFANIISDSNKLDSFLQTITETDAATGQSFLKIPLSDQQSHKKGLALMAAFLSNISKP